MKNNIFHFICIYTVFNGDRKVGKIEGGYYKKYILSILKKYNLKYIFYIQPEYNKEFVIFSKSESILNYIYRSHMHLCENNDIFLGKLYGYPSCCIKKVKDILINDDAIGEFKFTLNNSTNIIYSNILNIFDKNKIYFHTACSLDCKKTYLIAKKNMDLIKTHFGKYEYDNINRGRIGIFSFNNIEYTFE